MDANRNDIAVYRIIESRNYIRHKGYGWFVRSCMDFVREHIWVLSKNPDFLTDLDISRQFLEKKITEEDLLFRKNLAWGNFRRLSKNKDISNKKIQRLTVLFLSKNFLFNIENDDMVDSYDFLFLNLIWEIDNSLCYKFLDFIESRQA